MCEVDRAGTYNGSGWGGNCMRWFKHGKWPKALVWLHHYTIVSFALLLVTGILLYVPGLHTPLIPYLPFIYDVHILLGIVFGVTLIVPLLRVVPATKRLWRLDWWFPLVFGGGIVLTGLLLWRVAWFPARWRSASFSWHGDLSYVLAGYIIIHAFYKTFSLRPRANSVAGQVDVDRRRFARYLGLGVLGTAFFTIIDPGTALIRLFQAGPIAGAAGRNGATTTGDFAAYYTVTGNYPTVQLPDYRLRVDGAVANPMTLTWSDVLAIPSYQETVNFQCVTGWSVANVAWDGVHLSELVKRVQPHSNVKYVRFYSFDGVYTECLKLSEALDPTVLLAYTLNGVPLPVEQGHPLRLVVPKMYGYKSIKWVSHVEFSLTPITGYWEQRGYPTEAQF